MILNGPAFFTGLSNGLTMLSSRLSNASCNTRTGTCNSSARGVSKRDNETEQEPQGALLTLVRVEYHRTPFVPRADQRRRIASPAFRIFKSVGSNRFGEVFPSCGMQKPGFSADRSGRTLSRLLQLPATICLSATAWDEDNECWDVFFHKRTCGPKSQRNAKLRQELSLRLRSLNFLNEGVRNGVRR